ncbi:PTS sugar transporter subunit IIC [Floricoccus penangensis]|uniref:Permease IIC component n=1 Tax=Floricoccus penangensis TaxID=1859475 RepID=A0A9Q5JH19_9LACT|nr:PTS sugar transporter subunit IIC [Floricoccus penangensis]OFI47244.1 PTS cellobiose transporter subunit IIC [Floricoccus penangensis]URZ87299.1 PTS sugar transporter subunit IIC [Floricoccus penangensis]
MDKISAWLEKHLVPIAAKIGSEKHLVALRDAFIGTMPAVMAGSIAVMINAIIRDIPKQFWPDYDASTVPVIREIIGVNGFVWNGTLAVIGLMFAFSWGYNLAKAYKTNELAGGIVSVAAFIQGIAFAYSDTLETKLPSSVVDAINTTGADGGWSATADSISKGGWGWLKLGHLDARAYFTVMIISTIAVLIFSKLMNKNITIKMPDSVPPAVSKAFAAIIPATVAIYVVAIINFIVTKFTDGQLIIDLIQKYLAEPFLGLSQSLASVLIVSFFVQLFWFFGIHGPNVFAPVLDGIWQQALLINANIVEKGYNGVSGQKGVLDAVKDGKAYIWTRGSFDAYAWFGGSGGTLMLLIAIFIFSKRADYREVAKLGIAPGLFNINEPVMFGLPIVFNAIMFIPFILAPIVATTIGWVATYFGLVYPVSVQIPWATPPILYSFLATAGDWRAPIVTIVCMLASFAIWAPFVISANKIQETDI